MHTPASFIVVRKSAQRSTTQRETVALGRSTAHALFKRSETLKIDAPRKRIRGKLKLRFG